MYHKESSTKIYFTGDYTIFRLVNGNRDIDYKKVNRIENQIAAGLDILRYCPIMVQERQEGNITYLDIIEGQHRYFVCRKIKSKVWYVLIEDIDPEKIAEINNNFSGWKNTDYINFYVRRSNEQYAILTDFIQKHKISLTVAIRLLHNGTIRDNGLSSEDTVQQNFKKGKFEAKHLQKATRFMECAELFNSFKHYKKRIFLTAIFTVVEANKIDINALAEKFKESNFAQESNVNDYLEELENIASQGSHHRVPIY